MYRRNDLTLSNKKEKDFVRGRTEQKAFEEAKEMLHNEAILAYPNFSKHFDLYTDSSDCQLGVTLIQMGKPI